MAPNSWHEISHTFNPSLTPFFPEGPQRHLIFFLMVAKVLGQSGRRLGGGVIFEAALRWHTWSHAIEFPIRIPSFESLYPFAGLPNAEVFILDKDVGSHARNRGR